MERDNSRFNANGRRSGKPREPKPIKHVVEDKPRGIKFEVWSLSELSPAEVNAAVKTWLGTRDVKELQPWRTYRIQLEEEEEE